jgi:hypothetical protein
VRAKRPRLLKFPPHLVFERAGEPEVATRVRIITITDPRNGYLGIWISASGS